MSRPLVCLVALFVGGCSVGRAGLATQDGGVPPDSGLPRMDLGMGGVDTGMPPVDAGAPPVDTGIPPVDMGVPPVDMGMPPVDMGMPPVDMGMPPIDMGPPACSVLGCPGRRCTAGVCDLWTSCAEIHAADGDTLTSPTGTYPLDPDGSGPMPSYTAFCEMVADGGGWTLVLKVDGTDTTTFSYTAPIWEDGTTLNPTSLDYSRTQAKLGAYMHVAANQLRVGFLIAGGSGDGVSATYGVFDPPDRASFRQQMMMGAPSLGADSDWLRLVTGSDVQTAWRMTGVNVNNQLRLGLDADNVTGGSHPNSYVGIGVRQSDYTDGTTTPPNAGNYARMSAGGDRTIPCWAFVFVR